MWLAIVLNQQLNVEAPSTTSQFQHHISLLSSRSDSQRRDSLAYLTTYYTSAGKSTTVPLTTGDLLVKLCPLILDGSSAVRVQLLKLLRALPRTDIEDEVAKLLPHIRAGMTHLSREVRLHAVEILSWLIATAGRELVGCAGGWYQTLDCFAALLAWSSTEIGKWSASKTSLGDDRSTARVVTVLSEFLEVGMLSSPTTEEEWSIASEFPLWHLQHHRIPTKSNAYAYLNLFGAPRDLKNQMLEDREDRIRLFNETFRPRVEVGILAMKKEGGELGRASGLLSKVLDRAKLDEGDG